MEYGVYVIGDDGHFVRAVHLACSDDNAALVHAKQLVDGHDIELWQGDRKVATFKSHQSGTETKRSPSLWSAWKRKKKQTSFKVKIARYKRLARWASDDQTRERIDALVAELEQQLHAESGT